jgi:hypothetical protein
MSAATPAPWPPPPDLDSIRELVRAADPEGHIADGAAPDEYEPEEDAIFAAIAHLPTAQLTPATLVPIIEQAWRNSFAHDDQALARSRPALLSLAQQIARFFGPEAQPRTRNSPVP